MIAGLDHVAQKTDTSSQIINGKKSLGKDDFMKLLVTQLSAQDPLSPMESQDFSAQLAQFSSLEQMTSVNDNLKKLLDTQTAQANASAVNYLGKSVDAPGNGFQYKSGQIQSLGYSLDKDAASVKVSIFDATGNHVATLDAGSQKSGSNTVSWNGKNDAGIGVAEGVYTFQVEAADGSDNAVQATTLSSGVVSGIAFDNGVANAIVNGIKIPANLISRVNQIQ
ncbi:MAG: flagellar hook assembly protein FlgD [Nitrospinae bacterium]|nr:flagellar hook assembly protein FlgD [Nitrospinota bacterium]